MSKITHNFRDVRDLLNPRHRRQSFTFYLVLTTCAVSVYARFSINDGHPLTSFGSNTAGFGTNAFLNLFDAPGLKSILS